MKFPWFFVLMVALSFTANYASPIPPEGIHGRYNKFSRLAYCETRTLCLHEIGHRLDQSAGYPSQGAAFRDALNIHIAVALHADAPDALSMQILRELVGYPDGFPVKSELYANIFMTSDGKAENLPPDLRSFYDWKLANRLIGLLRDGETVYWFGLSPQ